LPLTVSAVRESEGGVGRWLPWCHDYSLFDAVKWFSECADRQQAGVGYDLGIFSADGLELQGGVAINQIRREHQVGNLGYWVRTSRQRQGIGAEALARMVGFGLQELGLERLEIVTATSNIPSRALAEKIGARFECIAPHRLRIRDELHDAAIYAIVKG
jgi:ribosomal-protein-serine acetyltransferase